MVFFEANPAETKAFLASYFTRPSWLSYHHANPSLHGFLQFLSELSGVAICVTNSPSHEKVFSPTIASTLQLNLVYIPETKRYKMLAENKSEIERPQVQHFDIYDCGLVDFENNYRKL